MRLLTRYLLHRLRQWDVVSANRVDYFIANSQHTARRIWRCYRRRAEVIYPPVNIERFSLIRQKQDFYVTVCRLVSYKNVSAIFCAFNQLGLILSVIGTGPIRHDSANRQTQRAIWAGSPPEVVEKYMAEAKAFVYAACEDFGIALGRSSSLRNPGNCLCSRWRFGDSARHSPTPRDRDWLIFFLPNRSSISGSCRGI